MKREERHRPAALPNMFTAVTVTVKAAKSSVVLLNMYTRLIVMPAARAVIRHPTAREAILHQAVIHMTATAVILMKVTAVLPEEEVRNRAALPQKHLRRVPLWTRRPNRKTNISSTW